MKYLLYFLLIFPGLMNAQPDNYKRSIAPLRSAYTTVNNLKMYYEVYGKGKPLVLIHGGGSTIQTSFGRIIPGLARNRMLIAVELQAHGRTGDRNGPISFEQDAEDIAALLQQLHIEQADILGFSNGGTTALLLAAKHPELCNKVIAASSLLKLSGAFPGFSEFMRAGTFEQMPQAYKDAFLAARPGDTAGLYNLFEKCRQRMIHFEDISDSLIHSIRQPVLLVNGDADVATSDHMVALTKLIPNCSLAIIPGGHGEYMGEQTTLKNGAHPEQIFLPLIEQFLDEPGSPH